MEPSGRGIVWPWLVEQRFAVGIVPSIAELKDPVAEHGVYAMDLEEVRTLRRHARSKVSWLASRPLRLATRTYAEPILQDLRYRQLDDFVHIEVVGEA